MVAQCQVVLRKVNRITLRNFTFFDVLSRFPLFLSLMLSDTASKI